MIAYKHLSLVERDFRTIKIDDLDLRPIYHYLAARVRAHILICMIAACVVWHLRNTCARLSPRLHSLTNASLNGMIPSPRPGLPAP